jgi:hypothetical protein
MNIDPTIRKYDPRSFPKRCGCGAVYLTETEWRSLLLVCVPDASEKTTRLDTGLELRLCPCGSSIAVKLVEQQ